VIIATGSGRLSIKEAIFHVLSSYPKAGKNVLISATDFKNPQDVEELKFLINNSSLFILAVRDLGEIETAEELRKLAKTNTLEGWLVLNFDDETNRGMIQTANFKTLTFGFQSGADFQATDVNVNGGTNFKVNYKGSTVPVWLEGSGGKDRIYSALLAACVATIFDLNLVEISQSLKNYHPAPVEKRE
jgi:hypothetical protein